MPAANRLSSNGRPAITSWWSSTSQGPYELLTNTAFQEGEDYYLVENCRRYRKAKPLLENGIHSTADMLDVMNSMRITRGPGRSLWTTIMDLNARTFEVRYFKEFDRKYEFRF